MFGEFTNKKLIAISIVISVVGLAAIYLLSLLEGPKKTSITNLDLDSVGKFVSTYGVIVSKRKTNGGHLFLEISDGKKNTDVAIFSNLMKYFKNDYEFRTGRKILVKGVLDEYRGNLQIVPRKPEDIKFYGDDSE